MEKQDVPSPGINVNMLLKAGDYDKMVKAGISVSVAEDIQGRKVMNIVREAQKMPGGSLSEKFDRLQEKMNLNNSKISDDIKVTYRGKYKLKYR